MSKILYACYRDSDISSTVASDIELIAERITPDNIIPRPPKIFTNKGIVYGIVNPVDSLEEYNGSVAMGKIFGEVNNWWQPLKTYPDGSYAVFRQDEDFVELVSDVVASRTIWYYKNDKVFIASTSQRAIVMLLKDFKFNKDVLTWILSTGGLGPDNSWDSRIMQVQPDCSVVLDRKSWDLKIQARATLPGSSDVTDEDHRKSFKNALVETFKSIDLDFKKWVLPLSGGYDSRAILVMLKYIKEDISSLKTITWGLAGRLKLKGNDAYVAKKLADYYRIPHQYLLTNRSAERLEDVLKRYFVCGEGRIDHVAGYLDGFRIWKYLFENKIQGIIRGDVCLTSKPAETPYFVKLRQGFLLCSDFNNLKNYQSFGFSKQEMPERLRQKPDENLEQWRDRLYQEVRIPVVLAALSDLKLPYVEVINPLLAKRIILQTKSLPDHLKNQKKIFKEFVASMSPSIEFATEGATVDTSEMFKTKEMNELFIKELNSAEIKLIFPPKFLEYVLANLSVSNGKGKIRASFKAFLKRFLPRGLTYKFLLISQKSSSVAFNTLAFRIYTVSKMNELLTEDSYCLNIGKEQRV